MHLRIIRSTCLLVAITVLASSCSRNDSGANDAAADSPNTVKLLFTYGSEKEAWVREATEAFNKGGFTTGDGKRILVEAVPMGSGECIDTLLTGKRQAHLTSPASAAFIKLGNAQSRAKTGKDLLGTTESLVLSPVVIAMWRPMAEAIGWGQKPIGWSDILALARDPNGWASHGQPQWGAFKFGHTHPEYSNSGLISVLAEAYAATNKVAGLSLADVEKPATGDFINTIEKSVVHYGSSTGFFGTKMFSNGPEYLSAAVLYENMVIESYSSQYSMPFPVVAVYPKEGTFWSDHPVGIVDREWVGDGQREAAGVYIRFLLDRPRQERALAYGFRPAAVDIPLTSPLDAQHGVDPKEPKTTLEVPPAEVIDALIKLWRERKRHTNLVLVLDTSGSMKEENRMENAKRGAAQFTELLGDRDSLSIMPFNTVPTWAMRNAEVGRNRQRIAGVIQSLFPSGGTALYDSIDAAYQSLLERPVTDKISAVVVLTDGADTDSRMPIETLLGRIRSDSERRTIRVFTIGYGSGAKKDILESIADATQAKFYEGTPENIEAIFREISTFF